MTNGPIKNMAASVRQRLMNVSKATNRRFSDVLQHYALERWLFRLSLSKCRDGCFLKGELLFVEKFEAMVKLGELNSRMKDFFDVALLAENFDFEENALATAIRATFDRRGTEVQSDPICFSERFARDPTKGVQWKAFLQRSQISDALAEFPAVVYQVRDFLRPLAIRMVRGDQADSRWPAGGRWQ